MAMIFGFYPLGGWAHFFMPSRIGVCGAGVKEKIFFVMMYVYTEHE